MFFVLFLFVLAAPLITEAVVLKAVADVAIVSARVVGDNQERRVVIDIKNNGAQPIQGVFGVRVQNQDGETVYTNTAQEVTVLAGAVAQGSVQFVVPQVADAYTVFAIFSSSEGVLLATRVVTTVEGAKADAPFAREVPARAQCTYTEGDIVCTSNDSSMRHVQYTVFSGGQTGKEVARGEVVFGDGAATLPINEHTLPSGRYGATMVFLDENKNVLATQELFFVQLQSSWMSIDIVSIDSTDSNFTARAFLAGDRLSDEQWGLWYWILDGQDNICAHEKQRFDDTLPREYVITQKLNDCVGAHLAVVVHLGNSPDGALMVADTYGDADVDVLITQTAHVPAIAQDINTTQAYVFWIIIAGVALIVIALFVIVGRARFLAVGLLLFAGAYGSVAHAATFVSGNETFTVTLEKTTYQSNETVDFTFSIVDSTTGQKPIGDSVKVKVDFGAYTTIVSTSDTATLYNVSLPAVSTGGAHNLNFIVPGHFFGLALFGSSRFGIGDREFSVSFNVTTNTAPPPPTVSGTCVIGQTNTYYFVTTDPDGDTIFYETYFNSESSNERLPGTGFVPSSTQVSTTRAKATPGNESVHVRATDVQNNVSSWNNQTIICVDACSHCVYNGGSPSTIFDATPSLVFENDTATLSWELENVTNCAISSNHPSGDAWNWDTVRTTQSVSTSPIIGSTIYTMQCDRVDGSLADPVSARVDLVPTFEEF